MSRYDATDDPLCYPGTQVLKNQADLEDQDELDQFEQLMFLTRSEEPLPDGNLDYEHYKAIHRHFFQDVYDWAGGPREVRTGKGGNWFCYPEYIDAQSRSQRRGYGSSRSRRSIDRLTPSDGRMTPRFCPLPSVPARPASFGAALTTVQAHHH
jgi:hypothetical protein